MSAATVRLELTETQADALSVLLVLVEHEDISRVVDVDSLADVSVILHRAQVMAR